MPCCLQCARPDLTTTAADVPHVPKARTQVMGLSVPVQSAQGQIPPPLVLDPPQTATAVSSTHTGAYHKFTCSRTHACTHTCTHTHMLPHIEARTHPYACPHTHIKNTNTSYTHTHSPHTLLCLPTCTQMLARTHTNTREMASQKRKIARLRRRTMEHTFSLSKPVQCFVFVCLFFFSSTKH